MSFDIPRVALQKTKYVVDNGLGGLMWWAVDEDWVEEAAAPQQAKRHLERKRKGKRSCKRPAADIGYVHAADPLANASSSSVVSGGASASASSSTYISPSGTATAAADASSSVPSSSSSISSSASASSSAAPRPDPSSTSEAEGEQDGIQLNIGRSLAQVAKEGFEKYAQGLDTTWNVLGYPTSGKSRDICGNDDLALTAQSTETSETACRALASTARPGHKCEF